MRRILTLLPDAHICVDQREVDDYRAVVPERQLIAHPPTTNLSQVRNWIIKHVECDCLVQIDDDLKRVLTTDGFASRPTRDPDEIMQILVNAANICDDAGIGVFAFSRRKDPAILRQDEQPFRFVGPAGCTFGMLGPARHRLFDERFIGRDDFDWTLRTLIEDRILFMDTRFYFDHGPIFSGRGGNVGLVDKQGFHRSTRLLKQLYGRCVEFSGVRFTGQGKQARKSKQSMSIRVRRKQLDVYT